MRFSQYLAGGPGDEAHFTFAKSANFQVLTKMFCTDQFANLVLSRGNWYPHENTEEIWPVEIDAPKDEHLYVMYWQELIWPLFWVGLSKHRGLENKAAQNLGKILIRKWRWSAVWYLGGRGEDWVGRGRRQRHGSPASSRGLCCRWEAVGTGCLSSKGLLCPFALLLLPLRRTKFQVCIEKPGLWHLEEGS